jgi:protein Tex
MLPFLFFHVHRMSTPLIQTIVQKTGLSSSVVHTIIDLLDQGNTVPFIARYRKEMTEGATDEQLRDFHEIYSYTKNLEQRKLDVIRLITEKGLMMPELEDQIMSAETLARVEDLYRPYKEKKNTKATIAKAKWLEPLSDILRACLVSAEEFTTLAATYINDTGDKKTSVYSAIEAIQWAQDIVAEAVSDDPALRDQIRTYEELHAVLTTKPSKTFEENGVYKIYGSYSKKISEMPSYAYLAVARAEEEKQLSLNIQFSFPKIIERAKSAFVPKNNGTVAEILIQALEDGLTRLLLPSIEREIRSNKKRRADEGAIKVFGDNLKHLLLTPPVRGLTVLGFDPGFRTGCKLAIVDATGKFLYNDVIYPAFTDRGAADSEKKLLAMITQHKVDLIVIGNGTASRESERFISEFLKQHKLDTKYLIVSEAGASVYSASELAQEEYPHLDVTVRGAISIAHRVQDPLAELTKIDPKAIGVWQYQHDVDQKLLLEKLDEKVEDVVNSVWVNVNTASYPLLQYIAGLSQAIAKNIVIYRDENGPYTSKSQLKKVKWLGPKAYEQCIWFLRIVGSEGMPAKEPLDATGIHPEQYNLTYELIEKECGAKITKAKPLTLPLDAALFAWRDEKKITALAEHFSSIEKDGKTLYTIGFETLQDIILELQRPGLDPREDMDPPSFKSDVLEITDLQIGMMLDGVVRNVVDFGAFVDIGLHNDGLVHRSQLADRYISHPSDVVSVGMQVKVKVLEIDLEREKVSLGMKTGEGITGSNIGGARAAQSRTTSSPSRWNLAGQSHHTMPVQRERKESAESSMKGNISWG